MKKKLQLSDAQKAHIAQVESIIEKQRKYRQYFEDRGMTETVAQYDRHIANSLARIEEIRAGVNFGVSLVGR